MSVTVAIPQPSEPKPVPNRWVWVASISHLLKDEAWDCGLARSHPKEFNGGRQYLLPGDQLAAALAELERASEELDKSIGFGGVILSLGPVNAWLMARRKVKALTPKGTNP